MMFAVQSAQKTVTAALIMVLESVTLASVMKITICGRTHSSAACFLPLQVQLVFNDL